MTYRADRGDPTGKGTGFEDWQVRIDPRDLVVFTATSSSFSGPVIVQALVNPTSFKESVQAHYALRPVLGLSHEVVQYVRTGTRKITMEIWLSYHLFLQRGMVTKTPDALLSKRNFFESLLVPAQLGAAPPLVQVNWPGADLWFEGVLESMSTDYERFDFTGAPIEMKMDLTFIEVARKLMTSPSVYESGLGYEATKTR